MTTEERTRRALEQARNNDSINRDATRRVTSSAISGSDTTSSRTERALRAARERDSERRRLTPSVDELNERRESSTPSILRPGAGTSDTTATGQIRSALDRFSSRGIIDTAASSENWSTPDEAEFGLRQWESDINELTTRLQNEETEISTAAAELEQLRQSETPLEQERYNALAEELGGRIDSYNRLIGQYENLTGKYNEGIDKYRALLGEGAQHAEEYRAEARRLSERNAEIERRLDIMSDPYVSPGGENTRQYEELQAEQESNAREIERLTREANDAVMAYYSGLALNEDFAEHSAPLGSQRTAQGRAGISPYYGGGAAYDVINRIGNADRINGYDAASNEYQALRTLTPEEVQIYNYVYATQGAEAAGRFLDEMRETLNSRLGEQRYENMDGLARGLYWIPAGLNQFTSGIQQLFTSEALPTSSVQYTSELVRQDAEEHGVGWLYNLGTTLSNMAPSIIGSYAVGAALAGAGVAGATAGRIAGAAGSSLMGASAGGNAYAQALREGYRPDQARNYGLLVGLSEGALQYLLGGIESLGGAAVSGLASKLGRLDGVIGRVARSNVGGLIGRMVSEGAEEGIQELLEPAFRTILFDEEYEADFEDAAYSFLLGALSAGVLEGPGAVADAVRGRANAAGRVESPEVAPPTGINFAALDGYLSADNVNYFEGVTDSGTLQERYSELANNDPEGRMDWETIYRQYTMAKAFLDGFEQAGGEALSEQAASTPETPAAAPEETGLDMPEGITPEGNIELPTAEQLERRQRAENATTELERSGILAGVSEENIGTAQRISSALGQEVRFYDGATAATTAARTANGYYLDGTIYINSRSANPVAQIIAHELTHGVEMAESYQQLSNLVLRRMKETGTNVDEARERKRELYRRNGVELEDAAVDRELVAEYVEHYLLTDEKSIRTLVADDRNLAQRILDWLTTLINRLRGRTTRAEQRFLSNARDAYARALRETQQGTPEPARRETAANTLEAVREGYNTEELSDEDFAAAMDVVAEQESLAGVNQLDLATDSSEQQQGRYSYGGRNAANANLEALDAAEEMERRNVDAETIRQQTGWFRGRDGKWRFEIDDSGMEYRRDGDANLRRESGYQRLAELTDKWEASMSGGEALTESERAEMDRLEKEYGERVYEEHYLLSDFIEHSELFENYPQLRYTSLVFDELPDGTNGYYNYEDGTIHLSNELIGEPREVLIHEIQHVIQQAEGFTRGASPEYWARREYESGDLVGERLRRDYDSVFNSLSREEQNRYTRYRELDRVLNQTMFAEPGTEEAAAYQRYEAEQDALYEELYPNEWFKQLLDLERRIEDVPGEYARMYRNTAGEIEARDAEARRRLTAEERRATPPDLGDENTVFADDEIPVKARFSIDENYERELDAWDEAGRPDGKVFILGRTGDVLQGLGATEQDIYLRSEKVNNIMQKHPEMTLAEIKRIPEVLDDPIIVAKSSGQSRGGQNTRLTMFGELLAQDGGPVMAVLDLRPVEDGIVINDMQKVNSAYHRNNELNYLRHSELLYVDENRAIPLLRSMGLQIRPIELQQYGSIGSISYQQRSVNIKGVPFDAVVQTDSPQYSISDPERRRDVMAQLRRYVGGDITSAELNNYLNGQTRAVNEEAGAAQDIIDRAHADGMSVDEFLRYNWEEFEADGVLNEDAQRALDLERLGAARRYGVADPERVSVLPGNVDVVQNATPGEYRRMRNASYIDYPWLMETGDSPVAQLQGGDGNTYTWREDQMSDEDVGYYMDTALEPRFSIDEDAPAEAPDALTQEYNELVASLPNKARPFLRRAENQLLDAVSKAFGVPYAAKRDSLRPVVQEITLEYMRTGTVSTETVDELFERAYEAGIVINREYYDQYKDVLDYLKNTQLRVSQDIVGDIPDFEDFRKANFGRLRISTREGSSNVDQVFMEMAERWPELFDAQRYIVPSDRLLRISSVANGIRIAETSLDRALGRGAAEFREESRRELDALLGESIGALRNVRRSAADEAARRAENEGSAPNMPQSQQEAAALWQELKQIRRDFERARARTLLTRADNEAISQLMSGQTTLQNLNPDEYNIEGIRAVYAAKRAYEDVAIQLRRWNQARRSRLYEQADMFLQNADLWKDKKAGALYSRETMERNIRDITPDKETADAVIATYFTPVHEATAQGNRIKNSYRKRVRELNLSRKVAEGNIVSEAHAVQLLGEAEDNIDSLLRSRGRVRERDGKSLEDWRGIVQNLWRENPKLDEAKIRGAVSEFRRIYDELFEQMNEVRVRNGYEPVNYRRGYFPHFQPGDGDGIISQFGRALGIDTKVTALPTSINGLTHAFRPGITWFGNAMERRGFNTAYDAVEGFDRYIEGVTDVITQTDNIQRLRALANRIRYNTTDEGMRARIDRILNDPTLQEEDKQNRIKELNEEGRFTLSNFVVDLEEYTNLLANKKSRRDRDVEQDAGRRIYDIMRAVSSRVAANMVAINPSSWLTNLIPLTQGWAQLGLKDLVSGMKATLRSYVEDDGITGKSTFLTNRKGSDPIVRIWEQGAEPEGGARRALRTAGRWTGKAGDVLSSPMEVIDMFVSGSLVRAKYKQALGKGMSEEAAMADADQFAANVIADRSKGAQPTRFGRRNPLAQVFNQFQLEVNNQLSYIFKDVPRETRAAGVRALAMAMLKFFFGALLYNEAYELIFGRRPALDVFGLLNDTVGDIFGWEVPNLLELGWGLASGNVPSFETEAVGLQEAGLNFVENAAEQLPFIGGVIGGGRLPISSALPDPANIWNALSNDELAPEYRRQEIADELSAPFYYVAMPFGGSIMNRIFDAIKATKEGGRYTYNTEGELQLQYPVYNDSVGEVAGNILRGGLFGLTTYGSGREWVEEDFPTLTVDQTAAYQAMVDAGVEAPAAYELIQNYREADSAEARRYAISSADIPGDGVSAAYYALMASEEEQALMEELAESGADMGATTRALIGVKNAQSLEGAEETEFKLRAIRDAELDQNDKISIYRSTISENQDEDIMAFLDAGLGFDAYLEAKAESARLSEKYDDSDERALAFAKWTNEQGVTEAQAQVMRDTLAPLRGTLGSLTESGLGLDAAAEVDDAIESLGEDAESTEKYMAIARLPLGELEKDMALESVMSASAYAKYAAAREAGIDTYDYCNFIDEIGDISGDGRQERIWALIDGMDLTRAQKDTLHLAAGYKESTLNKAPWRR